MMDNLLKAGAAQQEVISTIGIAKPVVKNGKIITGNCKLVNVLEDGTVEIAEKGENE